MNSYPKIDRLFLSVVSAGSTLALVSALLIFFIKPIYEYFYKLLAMSVIRPEKYFLPGTSAFIPLLPLILFILATLGVSILVFLALIESRTNESDTTGIFKKTGLFTAIFMGVSSSGVLLIIIWNFSKDAFYQALDLCADLRYAPYFWIPFSILNFAGLYIFLVRGDWSTLFSPKGFLEGAAELVLLLALLIIPFYWLIDLIPALMFYLALEGIVSGPLNALFNILGLIVIFSATAFFPVFALVELAKYAHRRWQAAIR